MWRLDLRLSGAEIRCDSQTEPRPWLVREWQGIGYYGFWQHSPGVCTIEMNAPAGSVIELRVALSRPSGQPQAGGGGRARASVRVRESGPGTGVHELAKIDLGPDLDHFTTTLRLPVDTSELQLSLAASTEAAGAHSLDWTDLVVESSDPDFAYAEHGSAWSVDVETALSPFFEKANLPERTANRRFLVIGLDGASWELMQPLLDAGEMPNLKALRERGRSGILRSTPVPESAMSWGAITSGVLPGTSGTFTFFSPPTSRRSFWHWVGDRDLYSVIVAVPNVAIDRPLNGLLVGDWTKREDQDFSKPAGLKPYLQRAGYRPGLVGVSNVAYFEAHMTQRTQVARKLLESSNWDLAFVVYEYSDTVAHRFGLHSEQWDEVYRSVDRQIGSLLESIDSDTTVLVVSDHGWKRFPRSLNLNAWLVQNRFDDWRASMARAANVSSIDAVGTPVGAPPSEPLAPGAKELKRLRRRLAAETHPMTRERIVTRMRLPRQVFPGPLAHLAPGRLFIEFLPDLRILHGPRSGKAYGQEPVDHHSFDGVYLLAGPGIEAGPGPERSVLDVAPSVLRYFGIAAPDDFDGQTMDDFGQLGSLSPPGGVTWEGIPPDETESDVSPDLEESLRALGYIE